MMFCPKCGSQNPDQARFCRDCGSPMQKPIKTPAPPIRRNNVLNTITAMIGSPLFLVGAIAYSLTVLFNFIQVFQNNPFNNILAFYQYASQNMSDFYNVYSTGSGIYILFSLLLQIPAFLILAGIWITFITSKTSQNGKPQTVGLTIIRVITIIQMVIFCLIIFILEIGFIIGIAGINQARSAVYSYGYSGSDGGTTAMIIFLMFIIVIVAIFCILYYIKLFKTIGEMITSIQTAVPSDRISIYVAVISIIGGVFTVIGMFLSSIITASLARAVHAYTYFYSGTGLQPLMILGSICSATAAIAFGIFLFSYRNRMRMCMHNPHDGYAPAPRTGSYTPNYNKVPVDSNLGSSLTGDIGITEGEETQAFDSSDNTVLLNFNDSYESVQRTIYPHLIQQQTGTKIAVNKPAFWIGSDPASVDYCISNNPTISRRHAQLIIQNGQFYIIDNHSTNHVYVDNRIIQPELPVLLKNNSRILLSDEAFIFQIDEA